MPEAKPVPGRNDPCPCGSGKKYKQCHLDKDEAARRKALAKKQGEAGKDADKEAAPAAAEPAKPGPPPRHQTQQPWKGPRNTKGFQKLTTPRRSGGS
jgi:hypothetical protein